MSFGTYLAIYFVVWWLCLFVVLPFGVRNQVDAGEYIEGTERGAPVVNRMWRTVLWTTVLSVPFTSLLLWGLSTPWLRQYWK